MSPMMDGSKLADESSRASVTPELDVSAGLEFFGEQQLEPIRPARGGIEPTSIFPAALDAGESSGREGSDARRLGPMRATRDGMDGPVPVPGLLRSHAAPPIGSLHSGTTSDPVVPAGPIRAMDRAADAPGGRVHPSSHGQSSAGKSTSAASGAIDPRVLQRGAGVARIGGIALSLMAVVGAAAGGGYFIWKTEFVRPELVAHSSPKVMPVVDLTPVHAANAALNEVGEPVAIAVLRTDTTPRLPVPQVLAVAQRAASAAHSVAGTPQGPGTNGSAGIRTPDDAPTPTLEPGTAVLVDASADTVDVPAPASNQDESVLRSDAGTGIVVRKRISPDQVAVSLERAYRAFLSGDWIAAAKAYRGVLRHEPGNRDAHLGLAALAVRSGRWNDAAGHYARVLESHPADIVARAALIAGDERDPARGESRLKMLLRRNPNAGHLHFDLGNLYAAQRRWSEAQRSWSNAYRFDPVNADYAYNLAVSLDHLSRPESALRHYREALLLSRSRAAGFESAKVLQRIRDLDSNAKTGSTPDGAAADAAAPPPAVHTR